MNAATETLTAATTETEIDFEGMFALSTDTSAAHAQEQAKLARQFKRESRYSKQNGKHRR